MELFSGTSGFAYDEWRGSFYPEALPAAGRLHYYAERLPTVEIHQTFYRMPRASVLEGWAAQVPAGFRFALKASRRITHVKRLRDAGEEVDYLYRVAGSLGERRGPILFQLPPYQRKDLPRLEAFLAGLPEDHGSAFEFRHTSWFDDEVFAALRCRGAALCIAETEEPTPTLVATAGFGYLRLRRSRYETADLERWAKQLRSQAWERAFVFFKHEGEGVAPTLATRFLTLFEARTPRRVRRPRAKSPKRA